MDDRTEAATADAFRLRAAPGGYVVRAGGAVIAETSAAMELTERGHDPVIYFPRADVAMAFLDPVAAVTTCPLKGEARGFTLVTKSGEIANAAWTYDQPAQGFGAIAGRIAFDARKVTLERV